MKKILLCCSAGMSTSMLVKKMQQTAEGQGITCLIEAHAVTNFNELIQEFDVCLLGPQVRFQQEELQKIADSYNKKVAPIPPQMYGMMKGDETLALALSLLPATA